MTEVMKSDLRTTAPRGRFAEPFGGMFTDWDRMFGDMLPQRLLTPFAGTRNLQQLAGVVTPTIDILENDTALILTAELPGLDLKDVELTLDGTILTLSGEKKFEKRDKTAAHMVERHYGAFRRSFTLPDVIDEDKIDAAFDKGILTVTLPKRADLTTHARKIDIH